MTRWASPAGEADGRAAGWGTAAVSLLGEAAQLTAGTVRRVVTPQGLRGLAVEVAWLAAHALLYPWGVAAQHPRPSRYYRTDALPPMQRSLLIADMAAATTPIVLVHGAADNRSAFALLARELRNRGFFLVHGVNYGMLAAFTGDVPTAAERLRAEIEQVCEITGADQVQVVGHSLGGLIARYYVQRMGGDERVRTLVTLGTPHQGTRAAYLLPTRLVCQLRPGSALLRELAEPAPGCRTRFLVVWSELDQVVIPQENAILVHPDLEVKVHRLRDVGHLSLPMHPRTLQLIVQEFTRTDAPEKGDKTATTG